MLSRAAGERLLQTAPAKRLRARMQQDASPIEKGLLPAVEVSDTSTVARQTDWPTWQVLSPGRSGTRWLADVLIASSHYGVVHASRPTLSRVGFLFDQGLISADEAWGAYFHSRAEMLEDCAESQRPLVDLDCKNSPMARVVLERNQNARCFVMLREPKRFILSGLSRGYFQTCIPYEWGHLAPNGYALSFQNNPGIPLTEQAELVAYFWNRVALLAQDTVTSHPNRTAIFPVEEMFASRTVTHAKLSEAGLIVDKALLTRYSKFGEPRNSTSQRKFSSANLELDWVRLRTLALDGLDNAFMEKAGL